MLTGEQHIGQPLSIDAMVSSMAGKKQWFLNKKMVLCFYGFYMVLWFLDFHIKSLK